MSSPTVFVSYSHDDEVWKDRLVEHLRVLEQEGLLDVWDDRRIAAGDDWQPEIEAAMSRAQVAVLLITASFLASDFLRKQEIPHLLDRHQKDGLRVIPLIVRPCAWKKVGWLAALEYLPRDGRALSGGSEHEIDSALAALAEEINAQCAAPAGAGPSRPVEKTQGLGAARFRRLWVFLPVLVLALASLVFFLRSQSPDLEAADEEIVCPPDRPDKDPFGDGQMLRESLDLPNAVARFKASVCFRDLPKARIALAQTLIDLSELRRARRAAEGARSKSPSEQERLWIEAQISEASGFCHKAVEQYAKLRAKAQGDVEILLALARAQIAAGEPQAAVKTVETASSIKDRRLALTQARAYNATRDYVSQLKAASLAITEGEKRPFIASKGYLLHAIAQAELNRTPEAFNDLKEAAKLAAGNKPLSADIKDEQGTIQLMLGNYQEALKLYGSIEQPYDLKKKGNLGRAAIIHQNRANVFLGLGKLTSARMNLTCAALEIGEDNPALKADLDTNLASLFVQQGRLKEARDHQAQAIDWYRSAGRSRDQALGLCNLAQIDLWRLEMTDAESELSRCKELARRSGDSLIGETLAGEGDIALWRGELAHAQEKYQEALKSSQELGQLDKVAEIRLILATVLIEKGQPAEALAPARQALVYFQEQKEMDSIAQTQVLVAQVRLAQRDLAEARRESNRAEQQAAASELLELRVRSPLTLARVADAEGRTADALAAAKRALAEAESHDHPSFRLEAELVLGQLEIEHPDPAKPNDGCDRLRKVEDDAKSGYGLVAQKAHEILAASQQACSEPQ